MSSGPVAILGGGISAIAFAHFSGLRAEIFEKEDRLGGLCRSFDTGGVACDIGPHIFFSKNEEVLRFATSLTPMNRLRRSNKIFYKGRFVKYPFENELSALPEADREWCLQSFLSNPHEDERADNMLAFFLKTFGEGITRTYLEPYNRKIWKHDPSLMDTQMVERIPKPPAEDIIASAKGVPTEGYLHQLHFNYPERGGAQAMVDGLYALCADRLTVHLSSPVEKLRRMKDGSFEVRAGGKAHHFESVVSAMPVHELVPRMEPAPPADVLESLSAMLFNAIHITIVQTAEDHLDENFAVMVPDPDIAFHRLSKLDFLGESYRLPGASTLMVEITFRRGDRFDLRDDEITDLVVRDLERVGFSAKRSLRRAVTRTFPYAYVIYDLHHRRNTDKVLAWLQSQGVPSAGRFATFEYINSDQALALAKAAAERFLSRQGSEI